MNILKFSELAVDYWEEFLLLRLFILAILLLAVYYILNKLVEWFFRRSNFFDEEVEKQYRGYSFFS